MSSHLNYHHLHYFWQVAQEGNLTRTAEKLRVSQSALSTQIKQLEDSLGQALFKREGRKLTLTEAGRIALGYADEIFARGEELQALFSDKGPGAAQTIRIGALSTLSRNFLSSFLAPLLGEPMLFARVETGRLHTLLDQLASHSLDVVLSNQAVGQDSSQAWRCQLIAEQEASIIGPVGRHPRTPFPVGYSSFRWILPGGQNSLRSGFDATCHHEGFIPDVLAEVDDMAMLRLLVRDSGALAVLPRVVVRDEIARGELEEYVTLPRVREHFYAIRIARHFEPPALRDLFSGSFQHLLEQFS